MKKRSVITRLYPVLSGIFVITMLLIPDPVLSAPFNSGSTGADGAFGPTANTILAVPSSGVFNFTTVNIPIGVTVTFARNTANTPVSILASGDVTISGMISVNGQDGASVDTTTLSVPIGSGGAGGPGGYAGGAGGLAPPWNGGVVLGTGQGLGPGSYRLDSFNQNFVIMAGCPGGFSTMTLANSNWCSNLTYGSANLLPLIGGSGGSGGPASSSTSTTCTNGCNGGGGGGGGGAILIASSGTVTVNGTITANGGNAGNGYQPGGAGSGGGIRLIANTIAGTGSITATGGGPNRGLYYGGPGRIRLEAGTLSFSGTINPSVTVSTPGIVNFSSTPTLSITSIGGTSVPATVQGSFTSPDITLPSSTNPNSITVNLAALNVPVGTIVKVTIIPRNSVASSYNSTALSGTLASSTATAMVVLTSTMVNVIRAEATFAVQTASNDVPVFAEGEKVEKIRVASVLGGGSSLFLITESGREIPWE